VWERFDLGKLNQTLKIESVWIGQIALAPCMLVCSWRFLAKASPSSTILKSRLDIGPEGVEGEDSRLKERGDVDF
jgi:hypothetical protein